MNQNWKNFLTAQGARFESEYQCEFKPSSERETENQIYALPQLAVLKVSGSDAATLLQGQVTCDVQELNENKASFGAFCTPKGRTLCVFFIIKQGNHFLLILSAQLLPSISKRLQMYILRADVQLDTSQDKACLMGLQTSSTLDLNLPSLPYQVAHTDGNTFIRLPDVNDAQRYILIAPDENQAKSFWQLARNQFDCAPTSSEQWKIADINSGIAWLDSNSSDEYIPQMLNLDQLGGISFKKGCYTGQEIIARTHYKGKTKRQMYLAKADISKSVDALLSIIDLNAEHQPVVGKVLLSCAAQQQGVLLVVLQISHAQSDALHLDNPGQDKITLTEFSYAPL